eukprot:scaffold2615_cov199-Alexandrium_tamarense.AAC.4
MVRNTTSILPVLLVASANTSICRAFQLSSPVTIIKPARVVHPQHRQHHVMMPSHPLELSSKSILTTQPPFGFVLRQSLAQEENSDDALQNISHEIKGDELQIDGYNPNSSIQRNDRNENPFINFLCTIKQSFKELQLQPSSILLSMAIFLLPLFLMTSFPQSAMAVQSGGRMGGSMGGGSRQSSSRTYAPSNGSYSRGYNRGYSSGYYSRPTVVVSPSITPYYSPFYSPFSLGPSYYGRPSGVVVSTGPSFGGLFFFAGFFLIAALALGNNSSGGSSTLSSSFSSALGSGVSVAEISVALDVPDRDSPNSILSVLDRLSRTARTDSRVGLQNLTSQVALELLRRKQSIVAASTQGRHYRDEAKSQREFINLSIKERSKFERETVSKYGGVDYSGTKTDTPTSPYSSKATVAVVTLVLQIDGDSTSNQLSSNINSIRDVEEALSRIAADAKVDDCLRGVEILWSPTERDETLTMKDVYADYSNLRKGEGLIELFNSRRTTTQSRRARPEACILRLGAIHVAILLEDTVPGHDGISNDESIQLQRQEGLYNIYDNTFLNHSRYIPRVCSSLISSQLHVDRSMQILPENTSQVSTNFRVIRIDQLNNLQNATRGMLNRFA